MRKQNLESVALACGSRKKFPKSLDFGKTNAKGLKEKMDTDFPFGLAEMGNWKKSENV
jgi:hypothetical protein